MNLAEQAYNELYPDKGIDYTLNLKYSGRFKSYNANVRMRGKILTFNLSRAWKNISREIQIGLVEYLMTRIFKDNKKKTTNMDLYDIFMKKVHMSIPKTKSNPILEESFNRVNDSYFYGMIEKTNLLWGGNTLRKLGCYEYGTDTITISSIFKKAEKDMLDYIMYHEMLHKKHKFQTKNGRNYHHTTEFKRKEKEFPNSAKIENSIKYLTRKNNRPRFSTKFKYKPFFLKIGGLTF